MSFCSFLLFWLLIGKVRFSKELFFAANMYGLGVIFNAISVQDFMFGRIGYLFYLFEALAISLIVLKTKDKKEKSVLFLMTIMYALVFTFYSLILVSETNSLEYQSIFSKPYTVLMGHAPIVASSLNTVVTTELGKSFGKVVLFLAVLIGGTQTVSA